MYGQMTAGSWIYIGSQGILQGTYETFAAVARKRFGGTLAGRLVVTAGLGGMGGAQPLAVTMCDGAALCIEVDLPAHRAAHRDRLPRRARGRPRRRAGAARVSPSPRSGRSRSACSATRPRCSRARAPRRARGRGDRPDLRPRPAERLPARRADPRAGRRLRARATRTSTCGGSARACSPTSARSASSAARGAEAFDYGNALRGVAVRARRRGRVRVPRLRARLHPAAVLRGQGAVPVGGAVGRPGGHRTRTDDAILDLFGDQEHIARWIELARERVQFQGLPARICWLGYGERHLAGLRFNEMVASGELSGADRDRARPPRRRLGRLAPARDRGDARRLRRRRRLADPQRAAQHRLRRELGVRAPRRRRRDGQVDPRRAGRGRRRHRRCRPSGSGAC